MGHAGRHSAADVSFKPTNSALSKTKCRLSIALLLTVHALLLAYGAWIHSPTIDEPAHLLAGLSHWRLGRFDLMRTEPPLVRLVAALPVLAVGCEEDWSGFKDRAGAMPTYDMAPRFVRANGVRTIWLVTLARWACIPLSLAGALLACAWAGELYDRQAALLVTALWAFSPNLIGYAQLLTPDLAAATAMVAASYAYWRWSQLPTWPRALLAGVVLGLALLVKMSLLVLLGIWPWLWIIAWRHPTRDEPATEHPSRRATTAVAQVVLMLVLALYLLHAGYAFEGALPRLGSLPFASRALTRSDSRNRFAGSSVGELPVPLPRNYLLGLDIHQRDQESYFERYGYPSYLRGAFQPRGWWYYDLYGLAVKGTIGVWLLLIVATGWRCVAHRSRRAWRDDLFVAVPALALLIFMSTQSGTSQHFARILPVIPLALVWTSAVAQSWGRRRPWFTIAGLALLAWSIVSSLAVYPHNLSYFNELAGGPHHGHSHLLGTSVDQGQDLLLLARWLDRRRAAQEPLYLAYFGEIPPELAGIDFRRPLGYTSGLERSSPPEPLPPGLYAISVNYLRGFSYRMYTEQGDQRRPALHAYSFFRALRPIDRVGYSIYLYRVDAVPAAATTDTVSAPP